MRRKPFDISDAQLCALREWADSGEPRLVQRAQVVLLSYQGLSAEQVSDQLSVARVTVYKWRKRFGLLGLHGLHDLPRSGQPRKLTKATRDGLVQRTVFEIPPRGVRWSVRQLARDAGITEHQVRRIWADHGLRPHKRYGLPGQAASGLRLDEVQLCGLVLAPPHNGCVFAVRTGMEAPAGSASSAGERRGRRLRRSIRDLRQAEDSIFAVLDRAGTPQSRDTASQAIEAIVAVLQRVDPPGADHQLHAIFSSDATLEAVRARAAGRCAGVRFSALPLTCAWAEALEQWLSDASRQPGQGDRAEPIQALRHALSRHTERAEEAAGATFCWSTTPRPWSEPMARSA